MHILCTGYIISIQLFYDAFKEMWMETATGLLTVNILRWKSTTVYDEVGCVRGMAFKLAFRVPVWTGVLLYGPSLQAVLYGLLVSMKTALWVLLLLLFFCRAFWIELTSVGRLASWWKRLRLRMMPYTRLKLPDLKRQVNTNAYKNDNKPLSFKDLCCKIVYQGSPQKSRFRVKWFAL